MLLLAEQQPGPCVGVVDDDGDGDGAVVEVGR